MICGTCRNIHFVRLRDGDDAARAFAAQAVRAYRRAVLQVRGRIMRPGFIAAYLCAKRFGAAALMALSVTLSAQTVAPCTAPEKNCRLTPPSTFQYVKARPPFNAPVMFGGIVTVSGAPYWSWRKAGEPPTPCTAKTHAVSPGGSEPGCFAKIGDVLYVGQQFTVKATREATLSAIEPPRVQLSIAPDCSSLTERFTVPTVACLRISSTVGIVKLEIAHYPAHSSRFFGVTAFRPAADGSISVPYRVYGEALGTRRVAVYAINEVGSYSQILPETR
jgi:hypothetical protein